MTHRQRWGNAIAWTVIGSIAATFTFTGLTWRSAWQQILMQSLANAIYSGSSVALCLAVIPRVTPLARGACHSRSTGSRLSRSLS